MSKSKKKKEYDATIVAGDYVRVAELSREYAEQVKLTEKYNRIKLEQFGNINEAGVIWIEEEQRFRKVTGVPVPHPLPLGSNIRKRSGKIFANGEKIATIAQISTHPITNRPAYVLEGIEGLIEFCVAIPE